MNRFKIFTFGRVSQEFILAGEKEYLTRLKSISKVELHELNVGRLSKLPPAERKRKEASLLLSSLKAGDYLILLDEKGKELSSETFSLELQKLMNKGSSSFALAIGSAFGFDETIKANAKMIWSLSKLTFPFQLTRLIVIEQLYRAMTIMRGSPYHKS